MKIVLIILRFKNNTYDGENQNLMFHTVKSMF